MESPGELSLSLQRAIDAHNRKEELAGKHSESKMTEQLHRSGIRMRINSPEHIRQLAALSQGKEAVVWSPDSDDSFVVTPIKQSVKEEIESVLTPEFWDCISKSPQLLTSLASISTRVANSPEGEKAVQDALHVLGEKFKSIGAGTPRTQGETTASTTPRGDSQFFHGGTGSGNSCDAESLIGLHHLSLDNATSQEAAIPSSVTCESPKEEDELGRVYQDALRQICAKADERNDGLHKRLDEHDIMMIEKADEVKDHMDEVMRQVIHENVQLRDVVMELKNALVALTGEFKATKESWAKDKKSWAADKESLARIEKSVDANAIRKMEKQLESYEDKIELKDKMIAKLKEEKRKLIQTNVHLRNKPSKQR